MDTKDDFSTTLVKTNNLTDDNQSTNNKGMLIFALAQICFGVSNFIIQLASKTLGDEFSIPSFMVFRSLSVVIIAYCIIYKNKIQIIPISEIEQKYWFVV